MLKPNNRFKLDTLIQRQLHNTKNLELDHNGKQKIMRTKLWKLKIITKRMEKSKQSPVIKV